MIRHEQGDSANVCSTKRVSGIVRGACYPSPGYEPSRHIAGARGETCQQLPASPTFSIASLFSVSRCWLVYQPPLPERLVFYCRSTSASTAPRTPRRKCCPYAYVLITVLSTAGHSSGNAFEGRPLIPVLPPIGKHEKGQP